MNPARPDLNLDPAASDLIDRLAFPARSLESASSPRRRLFAPLVQLALADRLKRKP